ncbi:MAG: family containing protein [Sphingobacteriaceae bacterium]|jgi:hypothetical protein|nr:family containing protein [Sphingobacteriaceae bacterium]
MKRLLLFALTLIFITVSNQASAKKHKGYYYQIKIYHLQTKTQEARVDKFLQDAYLPALHRAGISNVGVFKPVAKDSLEQLIYVYIPFKKADQFLSLEKKLNQDAEYATVGKDYLQAAYNDIPYVRMESILLQAFDGMPKPQVPNLTSPKTDRVYELRSYESATENLSANKIGMFNDKEIEIFTNLDFNAVFYGQVISGPRMPNLMYMTTFNNKADRDKHWAAFKPEYAKISGLPQYQHNTSKNTILFLYPTDYSDI